MPAAARPAPRAPQAAAPARDPATDLAAAAELQAQRLGKAMAAAPTPTETSAADPPNSKPRPASNEVIWLDTRPSAAAAAKPAAPAAVPAAKPATPAPAAAPAVAAAPPLVPAAPTPAPVVAAKPVIVAPLSVASLATVSNAGNPTAPAGKPLDRGAVVSRLMDEVRRSDDPALNKAMAAAALSLVDPARNTLDPADLNGLNPAQTDQVYKFHDLVTSIRKSLASGQALPDATTLGSRLEGLRHEPPVHIHTLKLCRRVYSEADGLAVWRQSPVEVKDQSFNRRKDFFVVQIVRLPARLSVGKYRLKIRVTDQADASIDESSVPLQVVADQTLVSVRSDIDDR
ncbi:MAG: hypothetical protein NTW19_14190 [Planctomycetota bacterium]|nr:hypothetical protein [Planctomycetota bacterium]